LDTEEPIKFWKSTASDRDPGFKKKIFSILQDRAFFHTYLWTTYRPIL